jgi:hypothetical protein
MISDRTTLALVSQRKNLLDLATKLWETGGKANSRFAIRILLSLLL